MANWDKLNAELDALLEGLTTQDWDKWSEQRSLNRTKRKQAMIEQAKSRFDEGSECLQIQMSEVHPMIIGKYMVDIDSISGIQASSDLIGDDNYAMAA
jgi:hypothetical protein